MNSWAREGHSFLPIVVAVVAPVELDLPVFFDIHDPMIGNRDPVRVAADVIRHLLGSGERLLWRAPAFEGDSLQKYTEALVERIGMNNGQVLAPLQEMVDTATKLMADKVKEVRTLLTQEIDPDRETTTLGKALKTLRNLLDRSGAILFRACWNRRSRLLPAKMERSRRR